MKNAICFVLIFLIVKQISAQKQKVEIIDKKCNIPSRCECIRKVFICDTNISIIYYGNHRITVSEENLNSLGTSLKIYGLNISLDEIYFRHIRSKNIKYMSNFYQGDYMKSQGRIFLKLEFINSGINSSRPTTHEYDIVYDIQNKRIKSIKFSFLNE